MEFVWINSETEVILIGVTTMGTIFINFTGLCGYLLDLRRVAYSKSFYSFISALS
jgi:hypothetical protein